MDNLDAAILKYHEVGRYFRDSIDSCSLLTQCLSVDPINGQILELLNLALEANSFSGVQGVKGLPVGDDEWAAKMKEHRKRNTALERVTAKATNGEDEMNIG